MILWCSCETSMDIGTALVCSLHDSSAIRHIMYLHNVQSRSKPFRCLSMSTKVFRKHRMINWIDHLPIMTPSLLSFNFFRPWGQEEVQMLLSMSKACPTNGSPPDKRPPLKGIWISHSFGKIIVFMSCFSWCYCEYDHMWSIIYYTLCSAYYQGV